MDYQIIKMQEFYQREKALVTSPFISQDLALNKTLLDKVFDKLAIKVGGDILDIGCGTGLLSTYFSSADSYVGVDLNSNPNFQFLMDHHHQFIQGNSLYLPFQDEKFDLAICMDSFEHFTDPVAAAGEIYRVLKPDSSLFLSVPTYDNIAGLVKLWAERFGGYAPDSWAPFDFWKPQELEHFITRRWIQKVFRAVGFTRFTLMGFDREVGVGLFPWIWHPKLCSKVARALDKGFSIFSRSIVALFPNASLHTFWKITK